MNTNNNENKETRSVTMLAEERKQYIMNMLNEYGIVRVSDLSAQLNTTEATIRRDLDDLQSKGMVTRVHGGAKSAISTGKKMTLQENIAKCAEEKKKIAQIAYRFISERDCIILDSSATVLELAKLLRINPIKDLTLITPSFVIFNELVHEESYTLIFVGGKYNRLLNSTAGILAQTVLENIHVDKAFLGVAGLDPTYGFSGPYEEETGVKKCFVSNSNHQYMLADHTKFCRTYLYRFASPDDVECIITDAKPDRNVCEAFETRNVKIICE